MSGARFATLLACLVLQVPEALAFHTDETFSEEASVGGAGGVYYTGSPRFKRYTCAACHLDAPGQAFLAIAADPADLFQGYQPEATYVVTVEMRNETRGLTSRANYNTFALEILDQDDEPRGGFFGFDFNLLRATPGGEVLFARGQKDVGDTSWTFSWRAPPAGTGHVDWYFAAVDGDGASDGAETASDPIGDDVVATVLRIPEQGVRAPELVVPEAPIPPTKGCSSAGAPETIGLLLLAAIMLKRWNR